MKKLFYAIIITFTIGTMLKGCVSKNEIVDNSHPLETSNMETTHSGITKERAYEGVYNYCHSEYDWSIAKENPSIMYVEMGSESETEYQVIFRSYTGAFVYFYVDKLNGNTRMIEYVPNLDIKNEAGTINLHDYLNKSN